MLIRLLGLTQQRFRFLLLLQRTPGVAASAVQRPPPLRSRRPSASRAPAAQGRILVETGVERFGFRRQRQGRLAHPCFSRRAGRRPEIFAPAARGRIRRTRGRRRPGWCVRAVRGKNRVTSNATNLPSWFGGDAAQKIPAVKSMTVAWVAMKALRVPRWPLPAKTPPGRSRSRRNPAGLRGG